MRGSLRPEGLCDSDRHDLTSAIASKSAGVFAYVGALVAMVQREAGQAKGAQVGDMRVEELPEGHRALYAAYMDRLVGVGGVSGGGDVRVLLWCVIYPSLYYLYEWLVAGPTSTVALPFPAMPLPPTPTPPPSQSPSPATPLTRSLPHPTPPQPQAVRAPGQGEPAPGPVAAAARVSCGSRTAAGVRTGGDRGQRRSTEGLLCAARSRCHGQPLPGGVGRPSAALPQVSEMLCHWQCWCDDGCSCGGCDCEECKLAMNATVCYEGVFVTIPYACIIDSYNTRLP